MNLTRRGFFGALAAAIVAAVMPKRQAVVDGPVVGGIDPATFTFWRNTGNLRHDDPRMEALRQDMRRIYDECTRGGNISMK